MIRLLSSCLLALSLCACASPAPNRATAPPKTKPQPEGQAQVANVDAAAVAALRIAAVDGDAARAFATIRQATAAAPNRVDLARLALQFCLNLPGCEAEPYETRLRKLDPGNGVVWLGALARSQARRDLQAEPQILQALGQSDRVDLYWNTLLWRLASAVPPPPPPTKPEHRISRSPRH